MVKKKAPATKMLIEDEDSDSESSSSSSDEDAPIGLSLRKKRAPPKRYTPAAPTKRKTTRRNAPVRARKRKATAPASRQVKRRKSTALEPKIFKAEGYPTRDHTPLASEQGATKWWDAKPYVGEQK